MRRSHTCACQAIVSGGALAEAQMRLKLLSMCGSECGHLFLSPRFDMVKCSLILFLYYSLQMD